MVHALLPVNTHWRILSTSDDYCRSDNSLCWLHYFQRREFCVSGFDTLLWWHFPSIWCSHQVTIMHIWQCRSLNLPCVTGFLFFWLHWQISNWVIRRLPSSWGVSLRHSCRGYETSPFISESIISFDEFHPNPWTTWRDALRFFKLMVRENVTGLPFQQGCVRVDFAGHIMWGMLLWLSLTSTGIRTHALCSSISSMTKRLPLPVAKFI